MKATMTTAVATAMVEKIERLEAEIAAVYADADMNYEPARSGNVIRDAVSHRAKMREDADSASALLASFDASDEAA